MKLYTKSYFELNNNFLDSKHRFKLVIRTKNYLNTIKNHYAICFYILALKYLSLNFYFLYINY